MQSKVILLGLTIPLSVILTGCSSNLNQVHTTPANVMQLVKTGVGEIKSSNTTAGKNNPAMYNANTANIALVEREDMAKVEFMPTGYLPIGSPTKGGVIDMGGTITNTGGKNQSQNANHDTIEKNIKNNENTKSTQSATGDSNSANGDNGYGFKGQSSDPDKVSKYQTIKKGQGYEKDNNKEAEKQNKAQNNYGLNGAEQAEKSK